MKSKSDNVNKKAHNFEIRGHGENSVTYQLFNELDKHKLFRLLNIHTRWINTFKIEEADIEEVHLFPSFGKRYGYGEPDVIILASKMVIYVEVEMCNLEKKRELPKPFVKQINKFTKLARDIKKSKRKKLSFINKFAGESGFTFLGQKKLRSLYMNIKKEERMPCLLVISDSSSYEIDVEGLNTKMEDKKLNLRGLNLGWISLKKIKRMRNIPSTTKTIDDNLWKKEKKKKKKKKK